MTYGEVVDWAIELEKEATIRCRVEKKNDSAGKPEQPVAPAIDAECERLREPLTQNDRDILVAMLEVKASKAKPASGQDLRFKQAG